MPIRRLVACLVVAFAVGCSSSKSDPNPETSAAWEPDPALLGELAEPADLGQFTIRPPKGYMLACRDEFLGPGSLAVSWQSVPSDPAAGFRAFAVMIVPVPDSEPEKT